MPKFICRRPDIPDSERVMEDEDPRGRRALAEYSYRVDAQVGEVFHLEQRSLDESAWTTHKVQRVRVSANRRVVGLMVVTERVAGPLLL